MTRHFFLVTIGYKSTKRGQTEFGWITIDGKRYVPVTRDKRGKLVIYLYSDSEWEIKPSGSYPRGRKGTVKIVASPY